MIMLVARPATSVNLELGVIAHAALGEKMKRYLRSTKDKEIVEVGMDVVLGDCLLALVDSGIDEDAHFWDSAWQELDDDDLEYALNNPMTQAQMIEYVRFPIIEKMREVLTKRREETARHSIE